MIRVSNAMMRDIGLVTRMELYTQEYPLLVTAIKSYFTDDTKKVFLAEISNKAVGYLLMSFDKDSPVTFIDSIGVRQKFRTHGVGRKLVEHACVFSNNVAVGDVRMRIPSYQVDDMGDSYNIDQWLWKVGFKAVGVEHGACFRYGVDYDYYIFERMPT